MADALCLAEGLLIAEWGKECVKYEYTKGNPLLLAERGAVSGRYTEMHQLMVGKNAGYKIRLWNQENFDCNICAYTRQALERKKYAFVSDYIRLYALYYEGGIYLDSDIEVFRSFDSLLRNRAFTGFESAGRIGAWILASEKGNPLFKRLLDYYVGRSFYDENGEMDLTPNTVPVTKLLVECGLKPENKIQKLSNITVYPEEYFCPKNPWNGEISITESTYAMHYFKGAWNELADRDLPFIANVRRYVCEFKEWMASCGFCNGKVIVYGLGVVGRNVLEQLKGFYPQLEIECILVTKLDNGWTSVDGIPIIEAAKSGHIDRNIVVLVSAIPRYHGEIAETLHRNGYRCIYLLGKGLDKAAVSI